MRSVTLEDGFVYVAAIDVLTEINGFSVNTASKHIARKVRAEEKGNYCYYMLSRKHQFPGDPAPITVIEKAFASPLFLTDKMF